MRLSHKTLRFPKTMPSLFNYHSLNHQHMDSKEFLSRREFFRRAISKSLPILGVLVAPSIISCNPDEPLPENVSCTDCSGSCKGSSSGGGCSDCHGSCLNTCSKECSDACSKDCAGYCTTSCGRQCSDDCMLSCKTACTTECRDDCWRTCKGSCTKDCAANCKDLLTR